MSGQRTSLNYHDIQSLIRRYRAKSVGQKMTLLIVGEYMGIHGDEWSCWPSMTTIAKEGQQNVSTVRRHLAELEESGVIERVSRGREGGGRDSNLIILHVETLTDQTASKARFDEVTKARPSDDQSAPSEGAKRALDDFVPPIGTTTEPLRTTSADAAEVDDRPEARRLCDLLATLVEENGSKRPTVTDAWVTEADRLIRLDGRTAEQVERAIRWSQRDPFWRANVMSMPKLREKYDQLRLAAQRPTANGNGNGATPAATIMAALRQEALS